MGGCPPSPDEAITLNQRISRSPRQRRARGRTLMVTVVTPCGGTVTLSGNEKEQRPPSSSASNWSCKLSSPPLRRVRSWDAAANRPPNRPGTLGGPRSSVTGAIGGGRGVASASGPPAGSASSARTRPARISRCRSSGGVTASSQCVPLMKNSMEPEGATSSIRSGRIGTPRSTAARISRITIGEALALEENTSTMTLAEPIAAMIASVQSSPTGMSRGATQQRIRRCSSACTAADAVSPSSLEWLTKTSRAIGTAPVRALRAERILASTHPRETVAPSTGPATFGTDGLRLHSVPPRRRGDWDDRGTSHMHTPTDGTAHAQTASRTTAPR